MALTTRPAGARLSGGLDSTTTLAIARHEGFAPCAITFRYGQRHRLEIDDARRARRRSGPRRLRGDHLLAKCTANGDGAAAKRLPHPRWPIFS